MSDLTSCVVKKHNFITIANVKVGTLDRDTPKPGKQKACKDSTIEIKTVHTPVVSRFATGIDTFPQFANILEIVSIQPFMTKIKMQHQTYFFLKVLKFSTIGHHRSLWYVDQKKSNEICYIQPKDVHQVQVMIAKHGELDEKFDVIVSRLGRAPILNAPLKA